MKEIFYTIIALVLVGCSTKREIVALPESINYNVTFRMLWEDYVAETKKVYSMNRFIPSDEMVKKYNLTKQNRTFFVTGFIFADSQFDGLAFEQLQGSMSSYANGIYTFRIPIVNLKKMVQLKGITRIELSKGVELKK